MTPTENPTWPLAEKKLRIAPSLLAADFAHLADQIAAVEAAGAEVLHLDIMDGHFVPNLSFGVPVVEKIRPVTKMFLDAHLMITDPLKYAEPFVKAGSDLITFHSETTDDLRPVVDHLRKLGTRVGVSLNPTTPVGSIEPILADVDLVLVMSVWPGFGGQLFIDSVLPKCRQLRDRLRPDQRLQIDGGLAPDTIIRAVQAGCDTIVAGSAIFGQPDPATAYAELHKLGLEARK
ncbi:MAG: ribulose-phosphate 3-epimerase [Phycisphaerales bacterium]|nr:MAG: ribulose-phosphate 3-epimerase [Phycisphaerales bacterium]